MNYQLIQELESIQKRIIEGFGRSDDPYDVAKMIGDRIAELKAKPESGEIITIPVTPPPGLLESMALRDDHSFGMSAGMADEEIENLRKESPIMGRQFLTKAERESRLRSMAQLHEEVVGKGFYRYE